jgi:hypothetical protein
MPTVSLAMQRQEHSDWCWAAVAVSVSRHFWRDSPWCQCKLAREMTKREKPGERRCCAHPFTKPIAKVCNQAWYLERALKIVGRLAAPPKARGLTYRQIDKEIRAGRPVCLRVQWGDEPIGHFVVITGCKQSSRGNQWLYIEDSFHGSSTWLYSEFRRNYQYSLGHWSHTYPIKTEVIRATS